MKQVNFILLTLICLLITLGCLKEELDTTPKKEVTVQEPSIEQWEYFNKDLLDTTSRNGTVPDQMMYLTSLSRNNVWLSQNIKDTPIQHIIYNKAKVRNIMFTPGPNYNINYDNRTWKHYNARVNFNDGDAESFTTYLRDTLSEFTYIPNGYNYLTNNHIANSIKWEQNLTIPYELKMNEWRNVTTRGYTWEIYSQHSGAYNHIVSKQLWAVNRTTNVFTIPYIN